MPSLAFVRRTLFVGLVTCAACSVDNPTQALPAPSADEFVTKVYPVLLRDCGFPECHGAPERFFRVFGPGRTRLDPETFPFEPPTDQEIETSYNRARSMLVGENPQVDWLLLRKPIPVAAGGAGHEGDDEWGNPVYASTQDPNYQVLRAWARSLLRSSNTGGVP